MITELTMQDMLNMAHTDDDRATIVMFYGSTCGPCKATMPHYEACSDFYESKNASIKFFRINAWEPEEQKQYCTDTWGVTGVPAFKSFYKNQFIIEKIGGGDEPAMKEFVHNIVDEVFKRFGEKI